MDETDIPSTYIFQIDASSGNSYTYNEVVNRSERLAAGLQELGVHQGDVVCILSPNHIEYPMVIYATALTTAVLQTLNPQTTTDDLQKVFTDYKTKYVFTIPELVPKVKDAITSLKHIQVIVFGQSEGCLALSTIIESNIAEYITPDADWKSTTAILYSSSGTTGFPKAVKMTHYALVANALQLIDADVNADPGYYILFLPMFHIYGLNTVITIVHSRGAQLVSMARFNIEEYLQLIQKYRPRTIHVVPPVMVLFAKHPHIDGYDLSSVNRIICGAAPLSAKIEEVVKIKLNLTSVHQGYGMTETGITHVNRENHYRHNSVGQIVALAEQKSISVSGQLVLSLTCTWLEVRDTEEVPLNHHIIKTGATLGFYQEGEIIDLTTGATQGPNQEGEVCIRGPQTANGFLNLPEQSKEMFLDDGWVKTGDIGKIDDDGFLYIVDRLKELIKYKGFQVAPAKLEDVLLHHEAVADVGVIGVPDLEAGELPKAYVVIKGGHDVTRMELVEYVAGAVAPYMKLHGGIEFVKEIPRSLSGKILRRTLRARSGALL